MSERRIGLTRIALRRLGQTTQGGDAPATATYILKTANASLPNAQVLGSLATGIVKNTTTTGVLSIATAGTDYVNPTGVAGGQIIYGGTAAGENLQLISTNNLTKGKIILGTSCAIDEVNTRLGIGTTSPETPLHVEGGLILGNGGIMTTTIEAPGWYGDLIIKQANASKGIIQTLVSTAYASIETDTTRYKIFEVTGTGKATFGNATLDHATEQIYNWYSQTTLDSATNPWWSAVVFWPATLTLTGSTAVTATVRYFDVGQPTITSASAITVSKAVTMIIEGAPTAGGSTTITEALALEVYGKSAFDTLKVGSMPTFEVNAADVCIGGAPSTSGIMLNVWADATLASGAAVTWQGITFAYSGLWLTGTTTTDHVRFFQVEQPEIGSDDAVTVTNASTAYYQGPPTAAGSVTLTNPWTIYVAAGENKFMLNDTDGDPIQIEVGNGIGGILLRSNSTDCMRLVATNVTDVGRILCNDLKIFNLAASTEYVHVSSTGFTAFGNIDVSSTGVGFNGTSAVAKPDITGSKASNAALGNLLTALASQGLLTDSTT